MYKLLLTFISIISFTSFVFSQKTDFNMVDNETERDFYIEKQLEIYNRMPSTLFLWKYKDWSSIEFNGKKEEGAFKMVDDYDVNKTFSFRTRSILSFPEKKIRFYGQFTYFSTKSEQADWNMFYKKSEIGSPFRLVTDRMGDWNAKHYGLQGMMNKQLNEKLQLGIGVKYRGDMYFRILDTRVEQFNLNIELQTAFTYSLGNKRFLSLGLSYNRRKSEIEVNDDFTHKIEEYYVRANEGLSIFNKLLSFDKIKVYNQNPSFSLAYYSGDKNNFSLAYEFYPGDEEWNRHISKSNSDKSKEMYKYSYSQHDILTSYSINKPTYSLLSKIKSEVISGKGMTYNSAGYADSYIYDGQNARLSFDILRYNRKLFNNTSFLVDLQNVAKKDMIYAQQIKYTNLKFSANSDVNFSLNSANKMQFSAEGGYKLNLSYLHDIASAGGSRYTLNTGYNEVAYETADYYFVGGKLTWHKKLKEMGLGLTLNYRYTAPTNIQIDNNYSILKESTNKNNIGLSFNLIF